ncbi:hypothetical protein DB313_04740 (plasmid) [Borrelia turcica IST7]|uniref:Lipoprotein n=1 Tax=Borrelia turcica IST7 TaxID=1104446 RepID=A0A386PP42_9SPIR|nr:hypothetical protein [Borrelia turcica]AYE36809.1 hypothetical protein DB313_04740 [Borrelia turcica IST7]
MKKFSIITCILAVAMLACKQNGVKEIKSQVDNEQTETVQGSKDLNNAQTETVVVKRVKIEPKTKEEAITVLNETVSHHKAEIAKKKSEFKPENSQKDKIPFTQVSTTFQPKKLEERVYAGLGHDVGLLQDLNEALKGLGEIKDDLKDSNSLLAQNVLVLLYNIGLDQEVMLEKYLNSTKISGLNQNKTMSDITGLDALLEEYMQAKSDLVAKIKEQLKVVASHNSNNDKEKATAELQKIADVNGEYWKEYKELVKKETVIKNLVQ